MKGTVYLIHFNRAYKHARHYLGYSEDLDRRLTDHLCGMGAQLMEVVTTARIEWEVSRTWPGDRKLERRLKNRKQGPALLPVFLPRQRRAVRPGLFTLRGQSRPRSRPRANH